MQRELHCIENRCSERCELDSNETLGNRQSIHAYVRRPSPTWGTGTLEDDDGSWLNPPLSSPLVHPHSPLRIRQSLESKRVV